MTIKSITTEQEERLQGLIDKAEVAYARHQTTRMEAAEERIFKYVNGLMAEQNAENARLQARIAEMEAEKEPADWRVLQGEFDALSLQYHNALNAFDVNKCADNENDLHEKYEKLIAFLKRLRGKRWYHPHENDRIAQLEAEKTALEDAVLPPPVIDAWHKANTSTDAIGAGYAPWDAAMHDLFDTVGKFIPQDEEG